MISCKAFFSGCDLCNQHDILAQIAQCFAEDLFREAVGIGVRGVKEIDAVIDGGPDHHIGLGLVYFAASFIISEASEGSCSETELGYFKSGAA